MKRPTHKQRRMSVLTTLDWDKEIDLIAQIWAELDGLEWDADTLDALATILNQFGLEVNEPDFYEEDE